MKSSLFLTAIPSASATVLLAVAPQVLKVGESYDIDYLLDTPYILQLELVQKGTSPNVAWTSVKTLFNGVHAEPCNGSYTVNVDDDWPTSDNNEQYAFWISGTVENSSQGYADLTDWFNITKE